MKHALLVLLVLAGAVPAEAGRKDWKVGIQCYTFRNKSLKETIDYCAANGIKYLEIYPGQRIGDGFEGKTSHELSAEEAAKLQAILKQKGVSLLSYGVVRAGNERQWREIFDFARRMGIGIVITEPAPNQMEQLDRLTAEYGVNVGIHNHGDPTPDQVEKLLAGRSKRIGIAPDNGHWTRRGFDNLASLKRFEGRILSIHLKDLKGGKQDVPFGDGTTPLAAILAYLDEADYKGNIVIEYEAGNQETAVRKCYDYIKAFIETGAIPMSPMKVASSAGLPKPVADYRSVVKSTDLDTYSRAARAYRKWSIANDLFRPLYHFTGVESWINDPNGPICHDGKYHLFYQFDPQVPHGKGMTVWADAGDRFGIESRANTHFLNAGEPVELLVFVDRGVLKVYCNGVAVTHKCFAVADRIEVFAFSEGGAATLTGLEAWKMDSMWK